MLQQQRTRCATAAARAGHGTWQARNKTEPPHYHSECSHHGGRAALSIAQPSAQHSLPSTRFFASSHDPYSWVPDGCAAPTRLSAAALEARLHGAQMMIVGDSLASEHFLSLMCMLLGRVNATRHAQTTARHTWRHAQRNATPAPVDASFFLDGGGVVQFVRSDFLLSARSVSLAIQSLEAESGNSMQGAPAARGAAAPALLERDEVMKPNTLYMGVHGRDPESRPDESWIARLRSGPSSASDVLILSTGPHWAGYYLNVTEGTVLATLARGVKTIFEHLSASDFRGRVLYRTNFVPGCGPPPTSTRAAEQLNQEPTAPKAAAKPHGWGRLPLFDEVWRTSAQAWFPKLRILNVSTLSSQRPDRHRPQNKDCLHFLLPGPPDVWTWMAFEEL